MTIPEILTLEFWNYLSGKYLADDKEDLGAIMEEYCAHLQNYTIMNYTGLKALDYAENLNNQQRGDLAYLIMGDAFYHIFKSLEANYDPLENFFSKGHRTYDDSGTLTKTGSEVDLTTGKEVTTPSGSSNVQSIGSKEHTFEGRENLGQGTTYESNGDSDFVNISKNKQTGTERETFNGFGTRTSFEGYKVEHEFDNKQTQRSFNGRVDSTKNNGSEDINKSGNSGIFSKQDLTHREVKLRLKDMSMPILVRMVVDVFNAGVWE